MPEYNDTYNGVYGGFGYSVEINEDELIDRVREEEAIRQAVTEMREMRYRENRRIWEDPYEEMIGNRPSSIYQPNKQMSDLDRKIIETTNKNIEILNDTKQVKSFETIIQEDYKTSQMLYNYLNHYPHGVVTIEFPKYNQRVIIDISGYVYTISNKFIQEFNSKKPKKNSVAYTYVDMFEYEKPDYVWNFILNHIKSKKDRINDLLKIEVTDKDILRMAKMVYSFATTLHNNQKE